MTRDLDRILDYVAALQALDTDGIEPTSHPIPLPTPLRPDEAAEPIAPALALSLLPLCPSVGPRSSPGPSFKQVQLHGGKAAHQRPQVPLPGWCYSC